MHKIRTKLVLWICLSLLVLVGGATVVYSLFAEDFYIYNKQRIMNSAYSDIKKTGLQLDEVTKVGREISSKENFLIVIFDRTFDIYYSSSYHAPQILNEQDLLVKNSYYYSADATSKHRNRPAYGSRITLRGKHQRGKNVYYIFISEDLQDTKNMVSYTNHFLIYLVVVSMVFGGISAMMLAYYFMRPIEKVNRVATKIANKDFTARYNGKYGKDEIGQLAKNINLMADNVQDYINRLNNYNFLLHEDIQNLQKHETMRRKMLREITHDLKTPLAIILSQTEMMQQTTSEEKRRHYYQSTVEEIEKMSNMITRVLQTSSQEQPVYIEKIERMNVSKFIEEHLSKYHDWFAQKQITILSDIEENCFINIAPMHFEQALNNFVNNAYRHTDIGKSIKISLYRENDNIVCAVYNDGAPIDKKLQEKIWDRFYQHGNKGEKHNIGLGLYIVQEIASLNGGSCEVTNEKNGVTFRIKLPVAE